MLVFIVLYPDGELWGEGTVVVIWMGMEVENVCVPEVAQLTESTV